MQITYMISVYRRLLGFLAVFALMAALVLTSTSRAAAQDETQIAGRVLERADLEAWLDGFFPQALQQANIAGAVVVVVKDGEVLLKKGYGYADVQNQILMDPDRSIVGVGSVSKVFAWTAIMQLVEQGKLDLDTDINAYLDFEIPAAFGAPITLRHLMTHSAGFEERSFKVVPEGESPRSLGEYLKGTPVPTRIYPPGKVPAYSNYGAMLGGYIVERVSGESYPAYVERHIFEPLAMTRSSFRRPLPLALQPLLANNYDVASEGPNEIDNEEPASDPSGHLMTTADDISRFMIAHLQRGGRILNADTAAKMHALAFKPPPILNGMTLGFFRMDRNGYEIIGHPGDISGFHADLELLPSENVGIFVGLNSSGIEVGALSASNSLRLSLVQKFMDRYFPAASTPEPPTTATAETDAQLAAGEYWLSQSPTGDFMVAMTLLARYFLLDMNVHANEDGTITTPAFLSFGVGRPQTWREIGPHLWQEVGGDAKLQMTVEGDEVKSFAKSDVIAAFEIQRVPALLSASLNVPLALAAMVIVIISVVMWPVMSFIRWRYGARLNLEGRELGAHRLTRAATLVAFAYPIAWFFVLNGISKVGFEPWIRIPQVIGLACVLGAIVALWNAWATCAGKRDLWAKVWSIFLALAFLEIVWFSFAFHLISIDLNY